MLDFAVALREESDCLGRSPHGERGLKCAWLALSLKPCSNVALLTESVD